DSESTPAAPWLALTRLYASQTNCLEIVNGFAWLTDSSRSYGETTDPCGTPTSVFDHSPSSETPARSHFRHRRRILRSATRCSMNLTSHSCDRLPKKSRMSASSIQFTLLRMIPTHSASSA